MTMHPLSSQPSLPRQRGFSLIEVVMALGIIGFSLVALIGLLPVGLNTQKKSSEEARAVQVLAQTVQLLKSVTVTSGSTVTFPSPLQALAGSPPIRLVGDLAVDGTIVTGSGNTPVTHGGAPTISSSDIRGKIFIERLVSPTLSPKLMPFRISIAWPAGAHRDPVADRWSSAEGNVGTFIYVKLPD